VLLRLESTATPTISFTHTRGHETAIGQHAHTQWQDLEGHGASIRQDEAIEFSNRALQL
jgi:hypothetical protein